MAYQLVTGPAAEPVTLAEAKAQCRVDISDDDTLIGSYMKAARDWVERICRPRLALITQTWRYYADEWPAKDTLELRPYPLQSVTSVVYVDRSAVSTTWASTNYLVDTYSEPGRLRLAATTTWPNTTLAELNGLRVLYVAGFGANSTYVPEPIRQAILLLVGHWYENREPIMTSNVIPRGLEFTVMALLAPWRREM